MSLFAYQVVTTHNSVQCTSTGLVETGYEVNDSDRNILSAASIGGRIMPRILCSDASGSGSITLVSLDYSLDGGARWITGQTFSVAVSGTGEKATSASEIVCMLPRHLTHLRWSASTETLGASDSITLVLQLMCAL